MIIYLGSEKSIYSYTLKNMPLNRCTYIMLKGPNKGFMCGHGCKGTVCNRHTPDFLERCRKRQQEIHGTYRADLQRAHWIQVTATLQEAASPEHPLLFVSQPPPSSSSVQASAEPVSQYI